MKNHVEMLIKTLTCILLIANLCGCWNSSELDTLGIVMGVGIDKPEESGKVTITAQVVKPGEIRSVQKDGGGGGGGSVNAFWNIEETEETVFSAIRELTRKSSRKLYFPHNQVLIFSRSIAEEGIQKYVDFFERDPETRVNVWVLISQTSAAAVLDVKSEIEKVPANNIAKLIQTQAAATSQTSAVRLRELAERLMSKTTASIAPFIEISGEGDRKSAVITGTGVFKRDRLVGHLNKTEGRGLLWVLGKVKSGIIEVNDSNGDKVGLEIIRASGKIVPEIENDSVHIKVEIKEEGNIGEEIGTENLSNLTEVALLEKEKSEAIRNEVMSVLEKAQELNADIFGFGDAVHQHYPRQWKELETKWDEIFPNIAVEVDVDAKLRLMGKVSKPSVPEQEKK